MSRMYWLLVWAIFSFWLLGPACNSCSADTHENYFAIQVVDAETKRGVPMVCLTTVNKIRYYTDSAGWIAFSEPGLVGKRVFFHIESHGYQYPKDAFGYRGTALDVKLGESITIEIDRINLAERLYRITGQGIYRDSMLLGKECPTESPLLNGDVLGQDTVQSVVYRGKIYWFWGDTNRPGYPLGQFKTSGAVSALPSKGGLSPNLGINLDYFVDKQGFSRQMTPVPGNGAVWLHGLTVTTNTNRQPFMFGHYVRLRELGKPMEQGLVRFNDKTQTFDKWTEFDLKALLYPRGISLSNERDTGDYLYYCNPFPSVRVRNSESDILDPTRYQSYTCLKLGATYNAEVDQVDRDSNGQVVWGWKTNTDSISPDRLRQLVQKERLKDSETRLRLKNPDNDKTVYLYYGSVHWNSFRNRWVMIGEQKGGESSFIGEIWYAESDQLTGPWDKVRHILTHDHYSFYNPAHHPCLDQGGGRYIYFDGTFVTTFSRAKTPVPRYDYNQIMYRLDLGGQRMNLPKASHPMPIENEDK